MRGLGGRIAGALGLLLCGSLALAAPASAESKAAAAFTAHGSVEQVQVTGAVPGERLTLADRQGKKVETRQAGELGAILFRHVEPGGGYTVRQGKGSGAPQTPRFRVLSDRSAPPDPSIYDQALPAGGYGYLTTRDGTKLAINVQLPGPADEGPYPTLVEYSGYGYADPSGGESSIAQLLTVLGFAVVDVNMRGTGCSGGAFDYFEELQSLDGYDVIETVARQPWVLNGKPGMAGVSYGGISQLFVAATRPPSLAAITPLSVIDNTQTTLYPGGILNTGFAFEWAQDRVDDSQPASPTTGQEWAWERIEAGDEICRENQDLHTEAVDLIAKIRRNDSYRPQVADPLSPITFVNKIKVPVYMACQWTDEQTGGHCPTLASRFTGTDRKWFTFTNGVHTDSLDPATFNRWFDFMELYVSQRRPALSPGIKPLAPAIWATVLGIPGVQLPDDPIQQEPDLASALAAFEALPPVRILFDNGAGGEPGYPYAGFEQSFSSFPVPNTKARSLFLREGGALRGEKPTEGAKDSFRWDPGARPPTNFTGNTGSGTDGLWTATPPYDWTQNPAGTAASYVTPQLSADTAVLGAGAFKAWIRSPARDLALQVTVSEVRPDGKESFVQSGWLRTAARKLDREKSTQLEPVLSFRERDLAPLPRGEWTKITVPLYYQGHVYRAGSSIRVTISAVGGDQPVWAFSEVVPDAPAKVSIAHSPEMASRLLLPVVGDVDAPTGLPPCPALRGQPCRDYQPYANQSAPLP